jgi:hypothetical protein
MSLPIGTRNATAAAVVLGLGAAAFAAGTRPEFDTPGALQGRRQPGSSRLHTNRVARRTRRRRPSLRRHARDGERAATGAALVLGLGPVAKLPERGTGPGFTRQRLAVGKGVGVEIALELDDRDEVIALHDHCQTATTVVETLQLRPRGLWDSDSSIRTVTTFA